MEPWEQEWYYTRHLERAAAKRPCCKVCGECLEEIEDLFYEGLCRYCDGVKKDE